MSDSRRAFGPEPDNARGMGIAAPPLIAEIHRHQQDALLGRLLRFRLWLAPGMTVLALALAAVDPAAWRHWVLLGAAVAAALLSVVEFVRWRRGNLDARGLAVDLAVMVAIQAALTTATGGLESPLLPVMLVVTALASVTLGRSVALASILTLQFIALLSEFAGHVGEWLPAVAEAPTTAHLGAHAATHLVLVGIVASLGVLARGALDRTLGRAQDAQDEVLRAGSAHARELEALAGEIAHELKNPLQSVKGLGALLARDLPDGRASERLAVLRREVDRMQGVLDDFLNFSRPLVPLSERDEDLGCLAAEVAALHEGLAASRGVRLVVADGRAHARCDARKVKQVLVNLVQNALDASPRGAEVRLEVGTAAGDGLVRVVDGGPGLADDVADRVFAPGVTSKPGGSGLGLTIARALARQHGGELTLRGGEFVLHGVGPGLVAELRLPVAGVPAPATEWTGGRA